jgi:glycerol uptake facilitator-like aquaporin
MSRRHAERVSLTPSRARRTVAEAVGTMFLLAAVVGSGIMGERLSGGNVAIALLANALATGAALIALILTFGPVSGAHFNPVVTLAAAWKGTLSWRDVPWFLVAQIAGALIGVALADAMFGEPIYVASQHARTGASQLLSEAVATFGLIAVIRGPAGAEVSRAAVAVAAYITSAYWFTSSTSFANPAVTIARAFTNTFAGIRPSDVPGFIAAQLIGGAMAVLLFSWLMASASALEGD